MGFQPRLSDAGMANSPWWYSNGNPFYANGYGLPNCTCYAYGRYAEVRQQFASLPTGDAKEWYGDATAFERGSTPRLGAIICFGSRSGTGDGHVAVVEVIQDGGNTIVTSNSAWGGTYFYRETLSVSNNYEPTDSPDYLFQGFIYNDAQGTIPVSDYVVAAICGNFFVESTINPGAWENWTVPPDPKWSALNKGYGLGQWTNTNGDTQGRLYQLHNYVSTHGYSDGNGDGQLDFFIYENYWQSPSTSAYSDLSDFLQSSSTDLRALVNEYMHHWEVNFNDTDTERLNAAVSYLSIIQARKNDDPSQYQWVSKNEPLSSAERINNVMCIYFSLNGRSPSPTPVPPVPGGSGNKFPVWMMYGYIFNRR